MPEAQSYAAPVLDVEDAVRWRDDLRAHGMRVVFTNGVFDLVHAGHVAYLAWARTQGDALLLGLNSDSSVRELKGSERPLVPFEDRAAVVAGLRSVDAVVGFAERTPEVLLDRIAPDVHVKSAQYRVEDLPERIVVLQHGGIITLAPHRSGKSTTDLIAEIRRRYGP
ncbi:MAG: adenylyltransferase/cytidyltransferase family protein [Candidatus Eremiobacteraeota bacterium]|nr:adenylyltransferase/cytidyltransferase family protein [Candidatus Eremiobacteraeota bacterium]MBC5804088.1 adenylyltransferase/cytidyltransferase family protein [Candidatus Eremiobacteraeota bacterium]MBC5821992.1 adenylyltransferase/cytidyltransferase family protein [Candidatus Eremiobacteraeota bacterium]